MKSSTLPLLRTFVVLACLCCGWTAALGDHETDPAAGNPACPGSEGCCEAHDSPGCNDEVCCQSVCAEMPFCCDLSWDEICVQAALDDPACVCADCNHNGIEDSIDIANGDSDDCDGNGIPDECDIFECAALERTCADCNCNGVLDSCDIESGNSEDIDNNGVPDDCLYWKPHSAKDDSWNNPNNWFRRIVPNNVGELTFSPTIAGAAAIVSLDIAATIDCLRLRKSATLFVALPLAQLLVVEPGGLLVQGDLRMGADRTIDVVHSVLVGTGGNYRADPDAKRFVEAVLSADSMRIESGIADPLADGGHVRLTDGMSLNLSANLTLDGECIPPCNDEEGGIIVPPPTYEQLDSSNTHVGGAIRLLGPTQFMVGGTSEGDATAILTLLGDFDNQATDPQLFDMIQATLFLDGGRSGMVQVFEVAGVDLGASGAGLINNFAQGHMTITTGSQVVMVNVFGNIVGPGPGAEALYVDTLVIEPGGTLTIDNASVYFNKFSGNPGDVTLVGDSVFMQIQSFCPAVNLVSAFPINGTVDARQPFEIDGTNPRGIGDAFEPIELTFDGPPALDPACYAVCDTAGDTNAVFAVIVMGNTAVVQLVNPIPFNAVSTVEYLGSGDFVEYFYHPANANADGIADFNDLFFLMGVVDGTETPPFGIFSSDINRDGLVNNLDVARLNDLLVGNGAYPVQELTPLPMNDGCP